MGHTPKLEGRHSQRGSPSGEMARAFPSLWGRLRTKQWAFHSPHADDHQGLAKVGLGASWRMGQRHEHLPGLTAILSDVVLDCGVSAVESVFVPEALEDALGSVALFPGTP